MIPAKVSKVRSLRNGAQWNWAQFQGSLSALKWNRRDLTVLDQVLRFVPVRRVCVQAGGNLGIWPKRLAQRFGQVLTFEPDPGNFAKLCHNAPEPNIRPHACALGADWGTVGLCRVRRDGKPDSHEGIVHVSGDGDVPMMTIDALDLPVCDLIYLDLEGYELFALRGAEDTLERCRPVVAAEINKHLASYGLTEAEIMDFMRDRGYTASVRFEQDQVFLPAERAA